ncbi:hypothetical protein AB0H17_29960 [Streptomyces olivoreticuli]
MEEHNSNRSSPSLPRGERLCVHPAQKARKLFAGLALTGLMASLCGMSAAEDKPEPPKPPKETAVVSMGDSFISGEAGRWAGNAASWDITEKLTDRHGSDRAYNTKGVHDPKLIYGPPYTSDGCHRSDVSEINSSVRLTVPREEYNDPSLKPDSGNPLGLKDAKIDVKEPVNIACSGATAKNIYKTAFNQDEKSAGKKPEASETQVAELARMADKYDIKLIVVSIGGNDINFSGVIADCVEKWIKNSTCKETQDANVKKLLPQAVANIKTSVGAIRETMKKKAPKSDYRLVIQSYPNVLPKDNRYGNKYKDRLPGGCPFQDTDTAWSRGLVEDLETNLRKIADSEKTDFLSLSDAFSGHELCAKEAYQTSDEKSSKEKSLPQGKNNKQQERPTADNNEWVRSISVAQSIIEKLIPDFLGKYIPEGVHKFILESPPREGNSNEFLHPNSFGQQALGTCLALHYKESKAHPKNPVKSKCSGTPRKGYASLKLETAK